jgi:hypothetical protein
MIDALNYYKRAQMIYEKTGATSSKTYALFLQRIGDVYQSLGQQKKAEEFHEKSRNNETHK